MKTSLHKKLSIRLLIAAFLGAIVALIFSYTHTTYSSQNQITTQLEKIQLSLQDILELPLWNFDENTVERICASYETNEFISQLEIKNSSNEIYCSFKKDIFDPNDLTKTTSINHNNDTIGSVTISLSSKFYSNLGSTSLIVNLAILMFTILVVIATSYFIVKEILTPIEKLKLLTDKIAQGDYSVKAEIKTSDELEDLASSFNSMTTRLQQSHQILEQQVKQRTKDLEATKLSLEQEIKKNMKQLKDQDFIKNILDNSPSVIYAKDTQGKYITVNKRYEQLFKITNEKIVGKTDYNIFPKEMADAFKENDQKVIKNNKVLMLEEQAPHDDGVHTYISVKFPLHSKEGGLIGVGGISTDITDRKKTETKLMDKVRELEKINSVMMNRELKMAQLKQENEKLKAVGQK